MQKNKTIKLIGLVSIVIFLTASIIVSPVSALLSQNSTSWYATGDTNSVAIAVGDVNGDGANEIVSAGYYNDGVNWNGQIIVLNSFTMAVQASTVWRLGSTTNVAAVAIGDVNADGQIDIVTAGSYYDGTNWIGQLIVWNGLTLASEQMSNFRLGQSLTINALAIADVNVAAGLEIITGATIFDGVNHIGHLAIWSGTNLALQQQTFWRLGTDTYVSSLAVATIGATLDIITGGEVFDGTNTISQVIIWNSANLSFIRLINWRLGIANYCNAIAVADVTPGGATEIVTAGEYYDGTVYTAQLIVWDSTTLTAQRLAHWKVGTSNTASALAIGTFSGGSTLDIVTVGSYRDAVRYYAQVVDWNSATLTSTSSTWFTTGSTSANSVAIGTIPGAGTRIIESGQYWDTIRAQAQVTVWG
jgi:hypothetical protein